MILKISDYAIRALVYIATVEKGYVSVKEINDALSDKSDISFSYLRKAMNLLVRKDYLDSVTGPGGGFLLKMDPKKIKMIDLITDMEGDSTFKRCYLGMEECREEQPCPFHHYWEKSREQFHSRLESLTLHDLVSQK